ncbi:MAG: sensor histidine kinase [Anaerolineales bacterium]
MTQLLTRIRVGGSLFEFEMMKIWNHLKSKFSHLRWKLAFSYFSVTVAALLIVELVVIVGVSNYILGKSKTTPEGLMADLSQGSYVRLGSKYLSKNPPDIEGLHSLLSQISEDVVEVRPVQIGDFIFNVSYSNLLTVMYTDAQGRLIATFPQEFMENTEIGESLEVSQIPGLERPFRSALAGEIETSKLVNSMSEDVLVGALPIFDQFDSSKVVGSMVFMHKSQFREILRLPNLARSVAIGLFFITLFVGILGTLFGILTAQNLVQRLGRLANTASAWSRGNFSIIVDDSAPDEIGQLTQALNNMAEQLENLLDERQEMSVLEERNRLARELHDSVKQQAFAASAQLAAARAKFNPNPKSAEGHLLEAENLVNDVRLELSDLIRELHPLALSRDGLATAIPEYAKDCANQSGIKIDVSIQGEHKAPLEVEQSLFRIIQGALSNAIRHSQAEHVEILLNYEQNAIKLTVFDNGVGFDPDEQKFGLGLRSMRERAELINSDLRIKSSNGEGTRISVNCPY